MTAILVIMVSRHMPSTASRQVHGLLHLCFAHCCRETRRSYPNRAHAPNAQAGETHLARVLLHDSRALLENYCSLPSLLASEHPLTHVFDTRLTRHHGGNLYGELLLRIDRDSITPEEWLWERHSVSTTSRGISTSQPEKFQLGNPTVGYLPKTSLPRLRASLRLYNATAGTPLANENDSPRLLAWLASTSIFQRHTHNSHAGCTARGSSLRSSTWTTPIGSVDTIVGAYPTSAWLKGLT